MNKKTKQNIKKVIISIVLILLSVFLLMKIESFYCRQKYLSIYKEKLENNDFSKIEDWMAPKIIRREFNINEKTIERIIGINLGLRAERKPLQEICREKKLNCGKIVDNLNKELIQND